MKHTSLILSAIGLGLCILPSHAFAQRRETATTQQAAGNSAIAWLLKANQESNKIEIPREHKNMSLRAGYSPMKSRILDQLIEMGAIDELVKLTDGADLGVFASMTTTQLAKRGKVEEARAFLDRQHYMWEGDKLAAKEGIVLGLLQSGKIDEAKKQAAELGVDWNKQSIEDSILAANICGGQIKVEQAVEKLDRKFSLSWLAVVDAEIGLKNYAQAAEIIAKHFGFNEFASKQTFLVINGMMQTGQLQEAIDFVSTLSIRSGPFYGYIAEKLKKQGKQADSERLMQLALENVNFPHSQFTVNAQKENLSVILQNERDFDGALKLIAWISDPENRQALEAECKARKLAAEGKLEEAEKWIQSLKTAEERAMGYYGMGVELARKKAA